MHIQLHVINLNSGKCFCRKAIFTNGSNKVYLRWPYTAVTRSTKKLYLIGFTSEDFNLKS